MMAESYYVQLIVRNQANDLVLNVSKEESDLLHKKLNNFSRENMTQGAFRFNTVGGSWVNVDLADVQGVHLLWGM
jgi:hypothetical protein